MNARGSYFGVHQLPDLIREHQHDARVDEVDPEGRTALFYARSVLEARFLVLVGVDPEHCDHSGAPATYHVGPDVGDYLVHGPKASYFGAHHEMLLTLNRLAGADPNERDALGRTPIFYAQSVDEATFLIEQGARLDVVDNSGASPLFTVPGGTGVVNFLVHEHKLDPNARDADGNSILHLTPDIHLLRDALAAGTTPLIVNRAGLNALEHRGMVPSAGVGASARAQLTGRQPPSQGGGGSTPSGDEGLILGILRGIFGAIAEVFGIRSQRR